MVVCEIFRIEYADFDFYYLINYNLVMLNDIEQDVFKQIVQAEDFVSSANLSTICNTSINTIRKTVENINEHLKDKGCFIDSKISFGYRLQITDPDIAISFINQTISEIERFSYLDTSNLSSAYIILERLLSSNNYISVEQLTNSMYCSKSTVLRIMNNVKLIASAYNIELKSKRNYGFYIDGNEWDIRNCLSFLEKVSHHSRNSNLKYDSIEAQLMNNDELKKAIRKIVVSSVNKLSPKYVSLPILNAHKIFNYIILSHIRKKYIDKLGFDDNMITLAKSLPTYEIAKDIYTNLPERFKENATQLDYISLSALLACCMVIQDPIAIDQRVLNDIKNETEELIKFIQSYYDITKCFDDDFKNKFYCYLYSLSIKQSFNYISDGEGLISSVRLGLLSSDVCTIFALFYKLKHNVVLTENNLIEAYYIFNQSLLNSNATHTYDKITALIIARNGYYEATNLRHRILKSFPYHFEDIKAIEFAEIYSNEHKKADILITNYQISPINSLTVNANEIIKVGNIHDQDCFQELENYLKSKLIKEVKSYLSEENIIRSSFKTKEEVYNAIYQRHENEVGSKDSFIKDLQSKDNFISFEKGNNIVMISPLAYKMEKTNIEIFINDQPIIWKQNRDIIFIFYSRGSGNAHEITLIAYILKQFLHQHPFFINTMYRKTYREIIRSFKF